MKNLGKMLVLVIAALAIQLPSCKKGDSGTPGENGADGADGNANVQTYTYSLTNAVWTTVGTVTSGYLQLDIAAPQTLTADVLTNNVVMVYVKSTDYADWAVLPYYTERNIRVQAEVSVGRIRLKRDQDGRPSTQSNFQNMRVVVMKKTSEKPLSVVPGN
ncbi:hypothetical protein ABIE26_003964 [Pedobacter africanus]|uniref:Uncharacterized protein n=1 Tax=Pedobacter africanus TaxID=151894 RepID=A0ACC6L1G3_9SPHI|nr:hypothetical protein [Pedobacter africanus]MDR6785265.1 hypothetical protein [Pedobacter africanus]